MFSIRTLAMATTVSAGVVFAMSAASQAMPASPLMKIDTARDGNIVDARHRTRGQKWARYCRYSDDERCYKRHRHAKYRYRYYDDRYYEPYYGYDYYRPRYREPGIGFQFRID